MTFSSPLMCPTGSFNACDSVGQSTFVATALLVLGTSGAFTSGVLVGLIGGTGASYSNFNLLLL